MDGFYDLTDDEEQQPESRMGFHPLATPSTDKQDPRNRLKEYIGAQMKRQQVMQSPEYQDLQGQRNEGMAKANDTAALGGLLMNSAALAGSINGHVADSSGPQNYAKQLAANNAQYQAANMHGEEQADASMDKKMKLMQYLSASRDAQDSAIAKQNFQKSQADENRDFRLKTLGIQQEGNRLKSQELAGTKNEKMLDDDERKFAEALDPNKARAGLRSDLQRRINAADNMFTMAYNPDGTPKNMNPQQMAELTEGWLKTITNGNATADARIERLLPHSVAGDIAETKQWLLGEPQGADQQKFAEYMLDSIRREKSVAEDQLRSSQVQAGAGYNRLAKGRPERYNAILKTMGVDPSKIDATGKYQVAEVPGANYVSPVPGVEGTAIASPGNYVKMQAPDGSVRPVPKESAQKYIQKGGKLLE